MKVLNIHKRVVNQSQLEVSKLFNTLGTKNDLIWPGESWPRMKFRDGIKIGSIGGHGPIRYEIIELKDGELISFKFHRPKGFNGTHKLELNALDNASCELIHTIEMDTSISGSLKWSYVIRPLHDALIEDAFDKVQSHYNQLIIANQWPFWVKTLRYFLR